MFVDISDKVIVVTGSSRGIGKSLAQAFAQEHAKVVINYCHSEGPADELYNQIIRYNENCIKVKADITKQEDVVRLYQETQARFGRVDVLINNAGICDDNLIWNMEQENWKKVIDVNLTGPYLCSRVFAEAMIQQKEGTILNIASIKGFEGCAKQVNYSASKAGLIGLTKALAKELGQFNIAVNAICPGFILTDLNCKNEEKKRIAEQRCLLENGHALNDLINFCILFISNRIQGVSGRVFTLDSRIG